MRTTALIVMLLGVLGHSGIAQAQADIASQLAIVDNAAPDAPVLRTQEKVKTAFDNCVRENSKTEFDTAETLTSRSIKAPCQFGGIAKFQGRGDKLAGDLLQYDAQRQVVYWDIPLQRLHNLFHGLEGVSAYDLEFRKDEAKALKGDQKKEIKSAGDADYLLIPIAGEGDSATTYNASNALGAHVQVAEIRGIKYSVAVNVGKKIIGYGERFRVGEIPLPREKAAELMPFLDVKLYWMTGRPCGLCLAAATAEKGTLGGPSFSKPYDIKILHKLVFAKLVAVRFFDRRDGTTVGISTGPAPNH